MKGGGDNKRATRCRLLSREELALWRHAIADVRPRGKKEPLAAVAPSAPPLARSHAPAPIAAQSPTPTSTAVETPRKAAPSLAPLAPMEKRLRRRLGSGKARVDNVLDLHGMTQAQAHRALSNFLRRCAENGATLVLVITGKGSFADGDGCVLEPGVLRRNAPHWLRAPEFRPIVLSIEEAEQPHGGSGALYVRLRRRAKFG